MTKAERARDRLLSVIERAHVARGEAQWTDGYRAATSRYLDNKQEEDRLYAKEFAQWREYDKAEARVSRAIAAYARAIRVERSGRGKGRTKHVAAAR